MKLIKPLVIVEDDLDMVMPNGLTMAQHMLKKVEHFTRKCYKSEGKMTLESYRTFVRDKYQHVHHTGIAEHRMLSVTFVTDRGVSHEGVRHRMAAYLQESTRYCDYAVDGRNKGVCFILPPWMPSVVPNWDNTGPAVLDYQNWHFFIEDLKEDEHRYNRWRERGWSPQQARYWLPNGLKTEYAASKDLGSWWNFCAKRASNLAGKAHPSMRQVAIPLLRYLKSRLPEIFDNLPEPTFEYGEENLAKLVVNPYYDQVQFEEVYSA